MTATLARLRCSRVVGGAVHSRLLLLRKIAKTNVTFSEEADGLDDIFEGSCSSTAVWLKT